MLSWRGMTRNSQSYGKRIAGGLFSAPVIILFVLFFAVPLGYSVYLSFFESGLFGQTFVGWGNYLQLLRSPALRQVVGNTLRYWLFMVPASVIVPLFCALLIMELPGRVAGVFRVLFYLPVAVGGVVLVSIWSWIFNPDYGILNYALSLVGLPARAWLADPQTSLFSIALVYFFASAIPSFTIIYCVAIGGLPPNLIEAGMLAGAGARQLIRFIVIPLLRPTMLYVGLTSSIASISLWVYPKMLTGGGPLKSSTSFGYWIYETAFIYGDFGLASAQAILMLLFVLVFCVAIGRTYAT